MNSYVLAFGILGLGVFLAVLLWSIPLLRRRRQVRRFRKALTHVETVAVSWAHNLRHDHPSTDVPTFLPDRHRSRRSARRPQSDDGGAAVA